jgi:hypothetical protein
MTTETSVTESIEQTISRLKARQSDITRLHTEFKDKEHMLILEHKDRVRELEAETEKKITDAARELNSLKETYKAECKAIFGVADGEQINILDVVEMIRKVASQ